MMIFVYFCVMMSAMPGGENIARYYAGAVEDSFRAVIEGRNILADQIADMRR